MNNFAQTSHKFDATYRKRAKPSPIAPEYPANRPLEFCVPARSALLTARAEYSARRPIRLERVHIASASRAANDAHTTRMSGAVSKNMKQPVSIPINSLQNASEFSDPFRPVSAEPSICAAPLAAKFYAVCNRH
ncbi:hypothetical protein [uncultured Campylobacter sp.]|uniref:hypothetical protein n=1 Tax=uncultured Campylobacter sp. TaxID=218934 RepID=UPI00261C01A0|nr:hypothetical protein [uncultured Campylobacter sp.]